MTTGNDSTDDPRQRIAELERLLAERDDAFAERINHQAATADVLRAMAASPGDPQPVCDLIVQRARALCGSANAGLYEYDGVLVHRRSSIQDFGTEETRAAYWSSFPRRLDAYPDSASHIAIAEQRVVHIRDADVEPGIMSAARRLGIRAAIIVPIVHNNRSIGAIALGNPEPGGFSDDQIALLHTFAEQAAIAITGAETYRALETRTTELRESLEYQTATGDVLKIISRATFDLQPVLDTVAQTAARLCDAEQAAIFRRKGDFVRLAANFGFPPEYEAGMKALGDIPIDPDLPSAGLRALREGRPVHIDDAAAVPGYVRLSISQGRQRTSLGVPLLLHGEVIGTIVLARQRVQPFTPQQIDLVTTFADQAVIAMENARLITEQAEALERQTAMAEVLEVINASPGDPLPVFEAILEKAHRICGAAVGGMATYDGELFRTVALHGHPEPFAALAHRPYPANAYMRALVGGEPFVHVPDLRAVELAPDDSIARALVAFTEVRTYLLIPLRKDGTLLGYIAAHRVEVRPYSDREITLLENFAAQAVIAIENARLITEQLEALEQQTATADILRIINTSPGDITPVFDAIVERAIQFCGPAIGALSIVEDGGYRLVSERGYPPAYLDMLRAGWKSSSAGPTRRIVDGESVVHLPDITVEHDYLANSANLRAMRDIAGTRAALWVALRKDAELMGLFTLYRPEPIAFTDKQINLVRSFADQAVIAMENARLLTEQREALEQQTATAEVLDVINRSPGNLAPVFDVILEKAHALCGVTMGALLTVDDGMIQAVATRGYSEELDAISRQRRPLALGVHGDFARGARFIHHHDMTANPEVFGSETGRQFFARSGGRTYLIIPLRKDGVMLGAITALRTEVRPFTGKEITLLENFAAQAVIAMENARLLTEQREALEQQTATADILRVINTSLGDLTPVFDTILQKAMRLCGAAFGILNTYDGDNFQTVAMQGVPEAFAALRAANPPVARPGGPMSRLIETKRPAQILDTKAEEGYALGHPTSRALVDLAGARTVVQIPLVKDDIFKGFIAVYRQEVRAFADKDIALLESFAAQAVIAMENARLLTEQQEALERQTATAEVLQVINASPGNLTPVFEAMMEKAMRLCEATFGALALAEGDTYRTVASHNLPAAVADAVAGVQPIRPGSAIDRIMRGEAMIHTVDAAADDAGRAASPVRRAMVELGGTRTALWVALRKEAVPLGCFMAYRREVRPFTDRQIALLENFAAQAVIAMENARLLTEQREALERQTAMAEVLGIINANPGNLTPVFEAILDKAMELCGVSFGELHTFDGTVFRAAAFRGAPAEYVALRSAEPVNPRTQSSGFRRLFEGENLLYYADLRDDDAYRNGVGGRRLMVDLAGARSGLGVSLRGNDRLLGAILFYRREVKPFDGRQIALLQSFAEQAVIAMENARLLTEQQEALERQTATADVLRIINESPGDLTPVFDAILEKALTLSESIFGLVYTFDGKALRLGAMRNLPPAFEEWSRNAVWYARPMDISQRSTAIMVDRLILGEDVIHVTDVRDDDLYRAGVPQRVALADLGGARSALAVALRKDGVLLGGVLLYRQEVRAYAADQIDLVKGFAAQAVIAMDNARLLTEQREALERQTAMAEVLGVINANPGQLTPVFEAILAKAVQLCESSFGLFGILDAGRFPTAATFQVPAAVARILREPLPPAPGSALYRIAQGEAVVHITDVTDDEVYRSGDPARRAIADDAGARTAIWVGLVKDGTVLGAIMVYRKEVRPFTERQIALLQSFAAQAVIAMENARLLSELRVTLDRQTAMADLLRVINESPGDLQPVFDAILEKAHQFCGAPSGNLTLYENGMLRAVATRGCPPEYVDYVTKPFPVGLYQQRLLDGERLVHVLDGQADHAENDSEVANMFREKTELRTMLTVPLRKDTRFLGIISAFRTEVRPFSEAEITLIENFAAQAVIAMENARLLAEQAEALERQTATADVLRAINASPGNLTPVFDTILDRAHAICGFAMGSMGIRDGAGFRNIARRGYGDHMSQSLSQPRAHPWAAQRALLRGENLVHIPDVDAYAWDPDDPADTFMRSVVEADGIRAALFIPLRRDNEILGYISGARRETGPFSEKSIELLQNFAAQAVIAMENARLLAEQAEALERQTVVADVLQVINRSPGDLTPVFDAMLAHARRLCGGAAGALWVMEGDHATVGARAGFSDRVTEFLSRPFVPGPQTGIGRLMAGADLVEIADLAAGPGYRAGEPMHRLAVDVDGLHSLAAVPLRKDGVFLGAFGMIRREPGLFTDKQISLLRDFAAQAVIAMENARLLNAIRQREGELDVTFQSMGDGVALFDETLHLAAWNQNFQDMIDVPTEIVSTKPHFRDYIQYLADRGEYGAETAQTVQRLLSQVGQTAAFERTRPNGRVIQIRTNPTPTGGFVVIYTDITERKRAEEALRAARDAAENALRELKIAQANLIQAEKMASLGQLTAGIAHEIKNPLNFVNNFASLSVDLLDEFNETAAPAIALLTDDQRADIEDVSTMLTTNLRKIEEHGKRADGIVRAMLEHSRSASTERRAVEINGLVDEALNLAYHGARAQDQNFNITLERDYGADIAPIEVNPQDLTRVFLNIFSNGFYAANKRARENGGDEPTLLVTTRPVGDAVEIRVRDNGTGIPAEIRDKLFQPFFTTKPTGEGTGLGLSITYDIVTKQHGGAISVDSEPGLFTEFTVKLPRHMFTNEGAVP